MPRYTSLNTYEQHADYPGKADWIARRLLALRHDLGKTITNDRAPGSLIIGSWNIRAFDGGLPRLDESMHYIAEIIATFDICAIQEVKSDLGPLKHLVWLLGPQWEYFVTDVSDHEGGNHERMAFVYNTDSVIFRNLIGEIVVKVMRYRQAIRLHGRRSLQHFRRGGSGSHWCRHIFCLGKPSPSVWPAAPKKWR